MNELKKTLSCSDFQDKLPELIESSGNLNGHPHLQTCELCRALLVDLQTIAEAARQLFPVVEPRDDLWKKIETALERESSGAKESREMK